MKMGNLLLVSFFNADVLTNSDLVCNVKLFGGNLGTADISELQALGLEVENKDPLPKNRANVETVHHAAKAVGNWVNPIVYPRVQENCRNINEHFSRMSWEIIAEANELDIFKIRFFI